ncbi:hypothetical protein [Devosia riboflavina]
MQYDADDQHAEDGETPQRSDVPHRFIEPCRAERHRRRSWVAKQHHHGTIEIGRIAVNDLIGQNSEDGQQRGGNRAADIEQHVVWRSPRGLDLA